MILLVDSTASWNFKNLRYAWFYKALEETIA